jgi:hypothetical protein
MIFKPDPDTVDAINQLALSAPLQKSISSAVQVLLFSFTQYGNQIFKTSSTSCTGVIVLDAKNQIFGLTCRHIFDKVY